MKPVKPRNSQDSRTRILQAATKLFADAGFEATTIRAIAEAADIHPSLVMRYFGSKEELFLIAVKWDLHLPDLSKVSKRERGRVLIQHFLAEWEDKNRPQDGLPAMLRVALSHPNGAMFLMGVFRDQLKPALEDTGSSNVEKRAALVATQTLGLALTRYVLKLPAVTQLTAREIEQALGPTIQRYLDFE